MTKEFDARNAEKSRAACAAMEELSNSKRRRAEVRHNCDKGAKEVRHVSRQENDAVASPAHYMSGGIEAKDALKAVMGCAQECFMDVIDGKPYYKALTPMAFYWWGCAFKYLWRWTSKNGIEDLRKCRQCIEFLIEEVECE